MKTRTLMVPAGLSLACVALLSGKAVGQGTPLWEAYNDHRPTEGVTHVNATGYDMRITDDGGLLKNYKTGIDLKASLTMLVEGDADPDDFGTNAAADDATPAFTFFDGKVDLANGGIPGVRNTANTKLHYIFKNLDAAKHYVFRATSIRGNSYPDRWTAFTITGANAYLAAHKDASPDKNLFTKATFPGGNLGADQVALNSGENRVGSLVGWDKIEVGADGSFEIIAQQYVGPTPFGDTEGGNAPYGYAFGAFYLAEVEPSGGAVVALAGISGLTRSREQVLIEYTNTATSKVDVATVKLKMDGKEVAAVIKETGDKVTIEYKPSPVYAHGSTHTYEVTAKDKAGKDIGTNSEFKLPAPAFPDGVDLAGPKVVNGAFAVRYIWATGGTVTGLAKVFGIIDAASKAGFAGKTFDTTHKTLDYGTGGATQLFTDDLPYPDEITGDADWTGEDFIQLSIAHIKIAQAGEYTFGVHSDDGFAMRIKGQTFTSKDGVGQIDRLDSSALIHAADTGDSNTRAVIKLEPGVYRLEFFWWERGGGDFGELYFAKGNFAADADTDTWKLVGDGLPLTAEALTGGGGGTPVVTTRPAISKIEFSANNLVFTVDPGGAAKIGLESSADLKTWTAVNVAGVAAGASQTFTTARSGTKFFYRARQQ